MNQSELPHKVRIQQTYDSYIPVFEEILTKVENRLKSVIKLPSMPTYKARIKSFGSYYKKILRQKSEESSTSHELVTLTDMMGIRIICAFLEDIDSVYISCLRILTFVKLNEKVPDSLSVNLAMNRFMCS